MGKALFDVSETARRVFHQADEILGFALSKLCFEGPEAELNDTVNAQPAILTVSVACLHALHERWQSLGQVVAPRCVAGHSLGEFTALVAADVIDFEHALRLVRERGRLMKANGADRPGGMLAVLGLEPEVVQHLVEEASSEGIITVATPTRRASWSCLASRRPCSGRRTLPELAEQPGWYASRSPLHLIRP